MPLKFLNSDLPSRASFCVRAKELSTLQDLGQYWNEYQPDDHLYIYSKTHLPRVLPLHKLFRAFRSSRWFCVFCSTALRSGSFRWPSKRPWQKGWKTCWVSSTILPCNPCFRLKNPNYLKYPTKRFDRDFNAKTFTFFGHTYYAFPILYKTWHDDANNMGWPFEFYWVLWHQNKAGCLNATH